METLDVPLVDADEPLAAVTMRGIGMSFGGVPVLEDVDFDVRHGEVHALLGENGAGKSTLMKILEGVYTPDAGEVFVEGESVSLSNGLDAKAHGITMVFQEFSLIPTLNIAQNILLGQEPRNAAGLIDERKTLAKAKQILADMNVDIDPRLTMDTLAASYWQITEIAKALSKPTKVLVLDEPTASLTRDETDTLFERIRTLRDAGMAIIYISHRMAEIYAIADRITVLRGGRRIRTEAVTEYPVVEVISDMLGSAQASHQQSARDRRPADFVDSNQEPLLKVVDLTTDNGVNGISLDIHAGEVVGLAGLMGSGRSEFALSLFGMDKILSGSISVGGKVVKISNPRDAIAAGIALVPEDRRMEGLVLEHALDNNAELPLVTATRKGWIRRSYTSTLVNKVISDMDVRTSSPHKVIGTLSGGNQQKVVIGKWLLTEPRVFILDEPTAGIDIGSKTEIAAKLRRFAAEGKAVLVISSELEELLEVSDRIVVLRNGRIDDAYEGQHFTNEESLHRAVQGVSA